MILNGGQVNRKTNLVKLSYSKCLQSIVKICKLKIKFNRLSLKLTPQKN